MKNGPFRQCGLSPTGFALENLDPLASSVSTVLVASALGTRQILGASEQIQGPIHIVARFHIAQEIGSSSDPVETVFDSFS
jgi:hypothetical protein